MKITGVYDIFDNILYEYCKNLSNVNGDRNPDD